LANALLGLALIACTMWIHAVGLTAVVYVLAHFRQRIEQQRTRLPPVFGLLLVTVGLVLAGLHGVEMTLWAAAYRWLQAFDAWPEALFYSLDSFTTRGESGLVLPAPWQMLGAIEAANGVLLFGLTTAFMFAVVQIWLPLFLRRFAPNVGGEPVNKLPRAGGEEPSLKGDAGEAASSNHNMG
jgi:hypothetical protein